MNERISSQLVLLSNLQEYFAEVSHPWIFPCLKFMFMAQPHTVHSKGEWSESEGLIRPNPLQSL